MENFRYYTMDKFDKIHIRITKEEKKQIRVLAKQSRMSMSAYVRNQIFNNDLKFID